MASGSTATRALSISAKEVAKAVDSAVKTVADKHKVTFSPDFRIGGGTIIGRQLLKADVSLQQAEQIAAEITKAASGGPALAARPQLEPAVLVTNRLILCGFYPGPIPEIQEF
jgi:hypothetical protein